MIDPSILLALFTAILRAAAPPTFGKLPRPLLPFAALVIRTLAYTATSIVFPAKVPHYNTSPMLHVLRMVPYGELLDEREDIEVVW